MTVKILCGDCVEELRKLPDESVHCCVTSPPYWGLRDYGTATWEGGDADCEHRGRAKPRQDTHGAGIEHGRFGVTRGTQPAKNAYVIPVRAACQCGATRIDAQLGLEASPAEYVEKMVAVFREVRRVLRNDGTLWLNLGDSYHNADKGGYAKDRVTAEDSMQRSNLGANFIGAMNRQPQEGLKPKDLCEIPSDVVRALRADGWWLRSRIPWLKRNCLSGGAWVYARTQKGDMPMMVKDMVRLRPETVKLWNGADWTQAMDFHRAVRQSRDGLLEIELRSGERIGCTSEHRWPTRRGLLNTRDLRVGDVIESTVLPEPAEPSKPAMLDDADIGWFLGLYLAEGHRTESVIYFSGHVNESTNRYVALKRIAEAFDGTVWVAQAKGKAQNVCVSGPVLHGIVDSYITGGNAKTKCLTTRAWQRSNYFLTNLLNAYLSGDGHWDVKNWRWRLGFCNNDNLARDLRTLCARVGMQIRLRRGAVTAEKGGKLHKVWRGEIRAYPAATGRPNTEIVSIRNSRAREHWDIGVADDPHLFSLASGVLTHNSMPESTKDRPTTAVEYVFLLSKNERYYYDGEAVKIKSSPGTHERNALGYKHAYASQFQGSPTDKRHLDGRVIPPTRSGEKGARKLAEPGSGTKNNTSFDEAMAVMPDTRARRNSDWFFESWQGMLQDEAGDPLALIVNSRPFKEAHFATFPTALIEPCILAGCPPGGVVLDPFGGAGTTGLVADRLGRDATLIELNEEYVAMAERRVHADAPLFAEVTT